ncbi:RHS repeat-associated core domain-containing protein, partial [Pseudomonas sp. RA_35y_Pfl2_P32]|uniref:RHS repeat-associated core domain-containing protein n=1 Tax=Pseudomonas sp. RA_35y_Pfl2_P32 TaxID=3088705 RepID=UPI0030DD62EE
RWINPDPAGNIDGLNRFQMVGNNPIIHTDPSGEEKKKINKDIHMIWIGESPEKLATQADNINNTAKQASGYKVRLYLDTTEKESYAPALKKLKIHKTVHLQDSILFNNFQKSNVATIYNDFRSGDPKNLAFAADALRPYIVHQRGGLYSDVDDIYVKKNTKTQEKLGRTSLKAEANELLFHEPVFVPWTGIANNPQIINSSFAAHAGNSTLIDIMNEMRLRYDTIVQSGKYASNNGYIGDSILEKETQNVRMNIMTSMVGPRVYTDVMTGKDSEINTIIERKRGNYIGTPLPDGFQKSMVSKMPLGRYINSGNLHSWSAH